MIVAPLCVFLHQGLEALERDNLAQRDVNRPRCGFYTKPSVSLIVSWVSRRMEVRLTDMIYTLYEVCIYSSSSSAQGYP